MSSDRKGKLKEITKGSILLSPLFRRFLTPIILTMMCFTVAVYFFAVPYLKDLVYSLEEKSVQTTLNNIHKLIEANYLAIEAYKESVTQAHNRQLKNITLFMETYLENKYDQVQQGIITEDEAQWAALEELRAFRYGKNDYVWVADYKGFYLSHPDPKMNMADFSEVQDVFGNYILTTLIQQSMKKGEGYHSYWWKRLEDDLPAEKLTYAKLFPQWEWVIGTGVYLDDLETEVILRKEKMVEELRQILKPIKVANTGYLFIVDAWKNIIIHPENKLENTNMSEWINPLSGSNLVDDLISVAHKEENKVTYIWNRTEDKENYIYEKIGWVTHVDEFDWYVVASIYTDELNISSILLRNRILMVAGAVVLLSIIIVSLLISKLLKPIRRLSYTAGLVEAGDLHARSDVQGKDEIGFLAHAFNSMVSQLREIIENLDQKVLDRTRDLNQVNIELSSTIGKLEQYNWRVSHLNLMAEKLQASHSIDEIYRVISDSLSGLFHLASGILYMRVTDEGREHILCPVIEWGEHKHSVSEIQIHSCNSVNAGHVVIVNTPGDLEICEHIQAEPPYVSICMPLFTRDDLLGMVHLQFMDIKQIFEKGEKTQILENWKRLAITIEDQLAMALANMKLRERLQHLSVRDGLTGLFNRRYMAETMEREFDQAQRCNGSVGVIILDVDHFKNFNDTYGHRAGDLILIELSNLLSDSIRKGDVLCRYGGEEFLIILPNISMEKATQRAEMIRTKCEKMQIEYNEHKLKITVSLGIAAFPNHGSTSEEVVKMADNAMYRAKEEGRNSAVPA